MIIATTAVTRQVMRQIRPNTQPIIFRKNATIGFRFVLAAFGFVFRRALFGAGFLAGFFFVGFRRSATNGGFFPPVAPILTPNY
ncbi:hypothetical protein [Actibacterium lipolyticum]|uniref:hypothetical protein n=1 Tax=Actibacterium lipolyticum TaxID=1524263 RepID=UPI001F24D124|nr:hypothetical protein [Actibacterium lipolyticum]